MKRKSLIVVLLLCSLFLVAVFTTACSCTPAQKSNEYLKTRDFSFDNVAEIIYRDSCPPMTYSIKKGESAEGDKIIIQVLEAWATFQEEAFFKDKKKYKNIIGGTHYYECVFVDGSSITIYRNHRLNYVLNNFGECQLKDEEVYKVFDSAYALMENDEYLTEGV